MTKKNAAVSKAKAPTSRPRLVRAGTVDAAPARSEAPFAVTSDGALLINIDALDAKIRQRLDEAMALVGTLRVKAGVAGAEIVVDGNVVGSEPLEGEVFVEPGAHTIEARLVGYKGAPQAVTVAKGQSVDVALTLVKSGEQDGGAGKPVGPGGGKPVEEGGPKKGLVIAGAVTSAVLVGAGLIFAVVANGHAAEAEEQQAAFVQAGVFDPCSMPSPMEQCEAHKTTLAGGQAFTNLSIASIVIGGALGAGTVIYALVAPRPKPNRSVRVAPLVVSHGGGLEIVGRW
jgi:hypothetical protein